MMDHFSLSGGSINMLHTHANITFTHMCVCKHTNIHIFLFQKGLFSQHQTESIRLRGCEGKKNPENHVYEIKPLPPLTRVFYLVVADENIVLELQTLNCYILFELTLLLTNTPSPLYVSKQK